MELFLAEKARFESERERVLAIMEEKDSVIRRFKEESE